MEIYRVILLCNKWDDRAYTAALLGWALSEERRKDLLRRPKLDSQDLVSKLPIRKAKRFNSF